MDRSGGTSKRITSGAISGFEAWMSYAAVEYCFGAIGALVIHRDETMLATQWRGVVGLFVCYALLGLFLGAVGAFLLPRDRDERNVRKLLAMSIVVLFGAHGLATGRWDLVTVSCTIATAVVGFAVMREVGGKWRSSGLADHPWMVSMALIASSMAAHRAANWSAPMLAPAGVAVAIAIVWCYAKIRTSDRTRAAREGGFGYVWHAAPAALIVMLVLAPALLSSTNAVPATAAAGDGVERPNILLVTMDTVRADHLGLYGYERSNTPNLADFARNATVYTNFISASSITLTSHASIFTGLYPQSHGAYRSLPDFAAGRPLAGNIPTAASLLDSAGYRTMAVAANSIYLRREWAVTRGFQYTYQPRVIKLMAPEYLLRNSIRRILRLDGLVQDLDVDFMRAEELNQRAFELLDDATHQSSPFFLFLNYMDAHAPYEPPPPYSRMYGGLDLGITIEDFENTRTNVNAGRSKLDRRERDHYISQYDGAIAYMDENLGNLITRLKSEGVYDKTMIVITADHGESFAEKACLSHDCSVDQAEVHVPLIVKYPHQKTGARVSKLAGHVDLMPTMLEVAGVNPPAGLHGESLLRITGQPDRPVVAERYGSRAILAGGRTGNDYAIFVGSKKLVRSTDGRRALYDLGLDPGERHDLYRPGDPLAAELEARLAEWSRLTRAHYSLEQFPTGKAAKELESLGYAR